jgi:N-acetyltransferase
VTAHVADLQPTLAGKLITLRPFREDDWEALYAVASDPLIWEVHPAWDRYKEPVFREYFTAALNSRGALTVVDNESGVVVGGSRFANFVSETNEIEIGWTFLARSHWGGNTNREMKQLMLTHAFQYFDQVRFNIGATNVRSRRAIEKIGARLDGEYVPEAKGGVRAVLHVIYRMNRDDAGRAGMLVDGVGNA